MVSDIMVELYRTKLSAVNGEINKYAQVVQTAEGGGAGREQLLLYALGGGACGKLPSCKNERACGTGERLV